MAVSVVHGVIRVETSSRFEVVDITGRVSEWLRSVGGRSGVLTAFVPHTTAAIAVNEAEPGLMEDIIELLRGLTRPGAPWRHNRIDNNAHAHLGNVIVGHSAVVPVRDGSLDLGTWQRILFIEMDGPRRRRVRLVFTGEIIG